MHRFISIESHNCNNRVQRIIIITEKGILKSKRNNFVKKLAEIIEKYNNGFHSRIGCAPVEATKNDSGMVMTENARKRNI